MQDEVTEMTPDQTSRLRRAELPYPEAGRTEGDLPPGYHHLRRTQTIGSGQQAFDAAAAAVLRWQVQVRAGMRVSASSATVSPGTVASLSWRLGPVRLHAPCRVVYVLDEPRRKGFGYGTLPGHPEIGEEAFVVRHESDDTVTLTVIAFSKPATLLAKAGGPAARAVQELMTRRYFRALVSQ